jgi:hypothetical protein
MTGTADILPGHSGVCHRSHGFFDERYEEAATRVERDYQHEFLRYGAVLRVVPITIEFQEVEPGRGSRRRFRPGRRGAARVGDGVAVRIDPSRGRDRPQWVWWQEAEADMIVRHRAKSDERWVVLHSAEQVEALLREQADVYLRQFALSETEVPAF